VAPQFVAAVRLRSDLNLVVLAGHERELGIVVGAGFSRKASCNPFSSARMFGNSDQARILLRDRCLHEELSSNTSAYADLA